MNGARRPVRGCLKGRISAGGAVATLVLDVWRVSTANTNVFFNDVRDDSGIFDLVLKIKVFMFTAIFGIVQYSTGFLKKKQTDP
jgi:hypothetical protein